MKIFLLINTFLILKSFATCVPARKEIDYPDSLEQVGMYHRVHPSGNYLIVSGANSDDNNASVIDLTGDKAQAIETPMINETYPVEGTWNIIASPLHDDGMRFYKFEDLLKQKSEAKQLFSDPKNNNWYHSAAELPGSTKQNLKFRVMLYGEQYRDYEINYNNKGKMSYKEKGIKQACRNLIRSLDSPILSKDGTEVAASNSSINGPSTVIYQIKDNGDCELIDNLGFSTSKVNFSYPKKNTKGKIVYNAQLTRVIDGSPQNSLATFIYDRDTKTSKVISPGKGFMPSYPGMTEDGRVIYIDKKSRKIIIVDPNQLDDNGEEIADKSKCIKAVTQKPIKKVVPKNKKVNGR